MTSTGPLWGLTHPTLSIVVVWVVSGVFRAIDNKVVLVVAGGVVAAACVAGGLLSKNYILGMGIGLVVVVLAFALNGVRREAKDVALGFAAIGIGVVLGVWGIFLSWLDSPSTGYSREFESTIMGLVCVLVPILSIGGLWAIVMAAAEPEKPAPAPAPPLPGTEPAADPVPPAPPLPPAPPDGAGKGDI